MGSISCLQLGDSELEVIAGNNESETLVDEALYYMLSKHPKPPIHIIKHARRERRFLWDVEEATG